MAASAWLLGCLYKTAMTGDIRQQLTDFACDKLPDDITYSRLSRWDSRSLSLGFEDAIGRDCKYAGCWFEEELASIKDGHGQCVYSKEEIEREMVSFRRLAAVCKEQLWPCAIKYIREAKSLCARQGMKMTPVFRMRVDVCPCESADSNSELCMAVTRNSTFFQVLEQLAAESGRECTREFADEIIRRFSHKTLDADTATRIAVAAGELQRLDPAHAAARERVVPDGK